MANMLIINQIIYKILSLMMSERNSLKIIINLTLCKKWHRYGK